MRKIETTVYRFAELSDSAKEKVLEKLWDINLWEQWYENTIDYLKEKYGEDWHIDNIYFSGFASQGDGAMFEYSGITDKLYDEWTDSLKGRQKVIASNCAPSANGKHRGHYYHKNCCVHYIGIDEDFDRDTYPNCHDVMTDELNEMFAEWLEEQYRDVCHDMYRTLEKESEYLTSEEAIIETIEANEYEFTEDGEMI